jgi:hypothetical protein
MNNEENNNSKNDQNKAEEPRTAFKTIRFFNSFEEQEEDEIRWLASLSPEEHLRNTTSLIKRVFAEDLKRNPYIGTEIQFE